MEGVKGKTNKENVAADEKKRNCRHREKVN